MEHFHSDWTLKQITMLHVNAPTDPIFKSMCFNRFKIYLLYFSFVCLFLLMDTNSIYSVSPVKWDRCSEWSFGISLLSCGMAGLYYFI